ncbi:carbonic anhydrase 4-like [Trichomycterus rosablanca]|uniref:carbonic anhydrase 4-like n=1 Tax=Trichomycterus rosablanca TaxID=2290929 RepID=UPI002F355145
MMIIKTLWRNGFGMECLKAAVVFVLVLNTSAFKVSDLNFCYTEDSCNAHRWVQTFSTCGVKQSTPQSPINLNPNLKMNESIPPLELQGFGVKQKSWTVANIRHTVVVEFQEGMTVRGAGLKHDYRIVEMRFHWGSNTTNGSEHTLNKQRFPMEMQIVGFAPGFDSVEAASGAQSGLLMMGVFIDIVNKVNKPFEVISAAISRVPYPGDWVNVTPPALSDLVPADDNRYFQYQGGQTTPPCHQNVAWIVFEKPIVISRDQYLQFTKHVYYSGKNDSVRKQLVENYRFIQSNLDRPVFVSSAVISNSAKGGTQSQHFFICLVFITSILSIYIV